MIPMKTSKSNQNIGLRHATFDIIDLAATHSWRGGEYWLAETRNVVEGRETIRSGQLCMGSVMQDSGA